jgi:hypothetical protein
VEIPNIPIDNTNPVYSIFQCNFNHYQSSPKLSYKKSRENSYMTFDAKIFCKTL